MAANNITTRSLIGLDGWQPANESWAYASASTITVPSGAAAKYSKGDKIKLTQTTVKYFYIIGVADTVLTVSGGSTYTVANAAISANYYSHEETPIGFPGMVDITVASWSTSGTAFTNAPSTPTLKMTIAGNKCMLWGIFLTHGTSGGTGQFRATITSNQIPNRLDASVGNAFNISSLASTGIAYFYDTNVIAIMKYDSTAIAGNSAYFVMSFTYLY